MDVRNNLKLAIEDSGLKHKVIAERANLSSQKLCDIIMKRRKLDADELFDLCVAIGKRPDDLYFYSESNKPRAS